MNIIIDTNIFISALIKEGITREIIAKSGLNFIFPEFELKEIKEHKEEIIRGSGLSKKEFDILLLRLLNYVKIAPVEITLNFKKEAEEIMGKIDNDDVQFIATAIAFNSLIWSNDNHFKKQNKIKVLTTKEIINFLIR